MAADAAALLDYSGIPQAHVVIPWGQIAQELALLHTENVRSLILLSSWQREIVSFRR